MSRESTGSAETAGERYKFDTAFSGGDPIEEALAVALERASAEQRWDVVALLGRELEARRTARAAPNVIALLRRQSSDGGSEGGRS